VAEAERPLLMGRSLVGRGSRRWGHL